MKDLSAEERPVMGALANTVREEIEALEAKRKRNSRQRSWPAASGKNASISHCLRGIIRKAISIR